MNALVYVNIDRGIHKVKVKNALNEKRKKLHGFSFSINMANFEAFGRTKKVDLKPLFSKQYIPNPQPKKKQEKINAKKEGKVN